MISQGKVNSITNNIIFDYQTIDANIKMLKLRIVMENLFAILLMMKILLCNNYFLFIKSIKFIKIWLNL